VRSACNALRGAGFRGWLAGGCVRDIIMGRTPKDWDIVTDAPLEKIRALFPKHLDVGTAFGVVKLPPVGPASDPVCIDIAIFRKEEGYSDRRHPDVVEIGDEQTDVARRDFTINAMYYDPEQTTVHDYVSGHRDIGTKIIRSVGDPMTRFSEDALRLLRAVRFSAQLGFKIEKDTAAALKKCAPLLKAISRERVREELFKLLTSQRPVAGLEALAQNGLWEHVFGMRRVSIPADLRQLRLSWSPTALHWLGALGVAGLLGDPMTEAEEILQGLTERLRLTNVEQRALGRVLNVYNDSVREPKHPTKTGPLEWVELAKESKPLLDLAKSFIRRARGPSEKEKMEGIALIEQAQRWAAKPGFEKSWPQAAELMKEGFKAGPRLGAELRERQWRSFWKRPTA